MQADGIEIQTQVNLDRWGQSIETLIRNVYIGEGYSNFDAADVALRIDAIAARGEIFAAFRGTEELVGVVIYVPAESMVSRYKDAGDCEIHLLAVRPDARGQGIAGKLMQACIIRAQKEGRKRVWLWTQREMLVAQHLYIRLGFIRHPDLDFERDETRFLVLSRSV